MAIPLLIVAFGSVCSDKADANNAVRQFSYIRPWIVMKRMNGACFAVAQAFHGDVFVLNIRPIGFYISLVNLKFKIPAGEYPVGISLNGSSIVPNDSTSSSGAVEAGKDNAVTIKFRDHQIRNFLNAALLTVSLAGKDHLLFLSDTESMLRDLATCGKYDSDPLKSAR